MGCIQPADYEHFNHNKHDPSDMTSQCKVCVNANSKRHYNGHKQEEKKRVMLYRAQDPERWANYGRNWQRENRSKVNVAAARWVEAHREQHRAAVRRWYWKNREAILTRQKRPDIRLRRLKRHHERYEKNPEPIKERARVQMHRRRARKHNADGTHTAADVLLQGNSQRWNCWWCGKPCRDNYHVDHRVPLSRGGSDAPENLCITCPECNMKKGSKLPSEWNGRLL